MLCEYFWAVPPYARSFKRARESNARARPNVASHFFISPALFTLVGSYGTRIAVIIMERSTDCIILYSKFSSPVGVLLSEGLA